MSLRAVLAALLASVLALSTPGWIVDASAEPTREDLSAAEERLHELTAEFSMAVEAYNQAQDEHAALTAEIDGLRQQITELGRGIDGQAAEVAKVVRSLYQGTEIKAVEMLLDSREVSDLHRRAGYLQSAQQSQQGVLERFGADRRVLQSEVAELEAAEERAAALDAQLAAQAADIESRVAAQSTEVAELTATIERLEREAAERAAREAAERAAREAAAREAAAAAAAEAAPAREVAARADRANRDAQPETASEPAPAQPEPAPAQPEPAPAQPEPAPQPTAPAGPEPEPEPEPAPTAAQNPPPASSAAQVAVEAARAQLGKPYRWGAGGPDNFDCSGLTSFAWAQAGVTIPRSSGAQYAGLPKVDRANLRPGDLVFFGRPIHHVGIYAGNGQMIEAPYTGQVVRYRSIDRRDYVGAARPG